MLDLFGQALVAGLIISMLTAPLGCFVVWRRMAYFGDAISHSALLGVILGLYYQTNITFSILPVAILFALALTWLEQSTRFSSDTLLGIIAHLALASGITLYVLAAITIFVLVLFWRPFLLITLHEDVARVRGINVDFYRVVLMVMIAVTVAISIKLVGLLLITAMLIIPAATARFMANGPKQMVCISMAISALSVWIGLKAAWQWDTPAGPSIVLVAGAAFMITHTVVRLLRLSRG